MHGDLKPENVLVFEENSHPVAKLIDFDCSCFGLTDSDLVSIGGTPGWLAPEFDEIRIALSEKQERQLYTPIGGCAPGSTICTY